MTQIQVNANKRAATQCTVSLAHSNPRHPLHPPTLTRPNPKPANNTQTLLESDDAYSSQRKHTDSHAMRSQNRPMGPNPPPPRTHPFNLIPSPSMTPRLSSEQTKQVHVNANKQTAAQCTVDTALWSPNHSTPTRTRPNPEPDNNTQTLLGSDGANSSQHKLMGGHELQSQYRPLEP